MSLHIDPDAQRRRNAAKHPRKLNLRGALPNVPPDVKLPQLSKGLDELLTLRQQGREAAGAELDAQAALVRAEAADRDVFAANVRAQKPDPGTPRADAARAALAAASRRRAAIAQARAEAERDVAALIERDGPAFLDVIDAERTVAAEAATAALAVLEAARGRLSELGALTDWLMARKSTPDGAAANALQVLHRSLDRANAAEQHSADG